MNVEFDGTLNDSDIIGIKSCLNLPINGIEMARSSFFLGHEHSFVTCQGPIDFVFGTPDRGFRHLQIESLYEDYNWINYQGKLNIKVYDEPWRPLSERLPTLNEKKNNGAVLRIQGFSPICEVLFLGNSLSGYVNELDPDNFNENNGEDSDFPFVDLKSIEFIVFRHDNLQETLLLLEPGGFEIHVTNNAVEYEKQRRDGKSMRNIVLHHKII